MTDFFTPMPRALAHRGDSMHFPENTAVSFAAAVRLGVDVIETDVHLTADDEVLIWHDVNFSRVSGDERHISLIRKSELQGIDAGARFTPDGGKSFPFRDKGIHPLLLREALEQFPQARFNIDLKDDNPALAEAAAEIFRKANAENRVCIGSFHHDVLQDFRRAAPGVETSISKKEMVQLLCAYPFGGSVKVLKERKSRVIQIPVAHKGLPVLTKKLIRWASQREIIVQVWTINDSEEMERLFKAGVDGIFSDNAEAVVKAARDYSILAPPRQISLS